MRRGVEREGGASGCPDGVRFPVSAWFWSSGGNGRREPPAWPSCGRPSWHDSGRGSLERAFPGDARPAARPPSGVRAVAGLTRSLPRAMHRLRSRHQRSSSLRPNRAIRRRRCRQSPRACPPPCRNLSIADRASSGETVRRRQGRPDGCAQGGCRPGQESVGVLRHNGTGIDPAKFFVLQTMCFLLR